MKKEVTDEKTLIDLEEKKEDRREPTQREIDAARRKYGDD